MNKLKLIYSASLASIISVTFVTVITVWAELSKPLKDWLAGALGHHWVSKGVFSLLIYIITSILFYFVVKKVDGKKISNTIMILVFITILGGFVIFGFYSLHYFGKF